MEPNPYAAPSAPSVDAAVKPRARRPGARRVWYFVIPALILNPYFLRAFGYESYQIPSGSMVPTLLVGDHIFVNKFVYGISVPFTLEKLFPQVPARGDVVVFARPGDEKGDAVIKRVIGLPGDRIDVRDRHVFVNGEPLKTRPPSPDFTPDGKVAVVLGDCDVHSNGRGYRCRADRKERFTEFLEQAGDHTYGVFEIPGRSQLGQAEGTWTVEPHHVFVLGDNRDDALDSRFGPLDEMPGFGQVPVSYVKGRADIIWLSLGGDYGIRFSRLLSLIL
jgi:signal peptidase I